MALKYLVLVFHFAAAKAALVGGKEFKRSMKKVEKMIESGRRDNVNTVVTSTRSAMLYVIIMFIFSNAPYFSPPSSSPPSFS